MKRTQTIFILLSALLIIASSCKDQVTYADRLKEESKAIDRLILKNEFIILKNFPSNGVFKQNEFYLDPASDVYYNIVDYGDTTESLKLNEEIYARLSGVYFMLSDTETFSNLNNYMPYTMEYRGPVNNISRYYYNIPGLAVPLPKVGHNSVVKLIVPFKMGSESDRQMYQPVYYDYVTYRFENKIK